MSQCVTVVDESVGRTRADDLVIATFADSEAALLDRIVDLELEVRVWREIAQQAIHRLHDREIDISRCRAQNNAVRAEYRRRDGRT